MCLYIISNKYWIGYSKYLYMFQIFILTINFEFFFRLYVWVWLIKFWVWILFVPFTVRIILHLNRITDQVFWFRFRFSPDSGSGFYSEAWIVVYPNLTCINDFTHDTWLDQITCHLRKYLYKKRGKDLSWGFEEAPAWVPHLAVTP